MNSLRSIAKVGLAAFALSLIAFPVTAADRSSSAGSTGGSASLENPRLKQLLAEANRASGPEEIVRLADAGTDTSVIQSYVESSGRRFDLSADQIIDLHKRGVSSGVIATMIRSGANAEAQPAAAPAPPVQPIIITSEARETPPASTITYIGYSPRPYRYAYPLPYRSAYAYASCAPAYYGGYNYCGYRPGYGYRSGYWNYRPAWSFDYRFRGCW